MICFLFNLIKLKFDFSKENHSTQWNQSPELQCYIYSCGCRWKERHCKNNKKRKKETENKKERPMG